MMRGGQAVCDPSLCNWSHLLLLLYVKCKSTPCRMLLYLLAIKMNYQSENTTSVVRQEDCFLLCSAIYLPGRTGSYKGWGVMLDTMCKLLLPEKCQEIVSAL